MFTPYRHRRWLAAAVVMALSAIACGDDGSDGNVEPLGPEPINVAVSPASLKLFPGNVGTSEVRLSYGDPDVAPFTLAATGLPSGVTVAFTPNVVAKGATTSALRVELAPSVSPGIHTLTIRASSATGELRTATLSLLVLSPESEGFRFVPTAGTAEVRPGGEPVTSTILIERHASFSGEVALAIEDLPAGLAATLSAARTTDTSVTLTVSAAADVASGYLHFVVRGTAAGTADVTSSWRIVVRNPNDSLGIALAPTNVTLVAGGPPVDVRVDIVRGGSFVGAVDLDIVEDFFAPAGLDATLTPRIGITGTSAVLSVQAGAQLEPGTYELEVRGWDTASGPVMPFFSDIVTLTVTVVSGT